MGVEKSHVIQIFQSNIFEYLINYFNCIFYVCPDIAACSNRCICSLTKDFALKEGKICVEYYTEKALGINYIPLEFLFVSVNITC